MKLGKEPQAGQPSPRHNLR